MIPSPLGRTRQEFCQRKEGVFPFRQLQHKRGWPAFETHMVTLSGHHTVALYLSLKLEFLLPIICAAP